MTAQQKLAQRMAGRVQGLPGVGPPWLGEQIQNERRRKRREQKNIHIPREKQWPGVRVDQGHGKNLA